LQGRLSYPYQTGTLNFDYQIAQETMQYPGALTAAQVRKNRRQAINKSDYFSDWNSSFHFQQQHTLTPDWHFAMDIAERSMEGHGILTSAFQQSRLTQFLKPQVKGIWHSVNLTSGIDYQADRYQLKSLFGITEDRQQKYGVFGIASMPANTLTTLSAGMRAAQQNSHLRSFSLNNTINHALVTTLGSTFQVQPRSLLYLRRAGSFRFPKADENAFTLPGVNSLRTQHGAAYETGIETTDDTYTAKLNLYQLNLRDEITFDPTQTAQAPFGTNRNLPPTIRRGLSLSGSVQATNKLTLGGQYNTVNARFQSGVNRGKHIPLVAENIFRTNLDYTLAENLHFYTEAIYTGSQFAANDDANVGGKIGGYSIVNLNLGYYFKQLNASLRLNNIFNKFYYFYTVHQESMNSEFFYPAPGRNFTLTITYTFL
jgi:iron complex outermembrane receptor protein